MGPRRCPRLWRAHLRAVPECLRPSGAFWLGEERDYASPWFPFDWPTLIGNGALSTYRIDALILIAAAPHASEQLRAKGFEFCAAGLAEIAKEVHRSAIDHLPQFKEGLIGRHICIDNISFDLFGAFE